MQSTLAWPISFDNATYDWVTLSSLVPFDQLLSLSTNGLFNSIVYNTSLVDPKSVHATVNATTIHEVVIASVASVVLSILAFYMVGVTSSQPPAISELCVHETFGSAYGGAS